MPIIEMHLLEGRTVEQRRAAVAAITEAVTRSLGVKAESVRILITQHDKDEFSVAGVTVGSKLEDGNATN
ncbi:tautomerase family protein [Ampullimonas aquatilis]|uniref:tautomerase family protein n=1 Tax=Ampullimonas aquatilis TaxID=1341549 RepID=UPI003C78E30F